MKIFHKLSLLLLLVSSAAWANIVIPIYSASNPQQMIGTVTAFDSQYGLMLQPNLHDLPPGLHGFHVHENPSCAEKAMAAGGHLDPKHTDKHLGPYDNKGHLGDLPVLYVNAKGIADTLTVAPRLKESELYGHAMMIHAGGDNYSDQPEKLGGGGARIACGVIDKAKKK